MRRFVIGLLMVSVAWAQGGWQFGFRGGIGLPVLYNTNWLNNQEYSYEPGLTWNAGVLVGYNAVYYNYGIATGFFYRQMKHQLRFVSGAGTQDLERVQMNMIEVPLLVRFRSRGDVRTRTFTYGGPYLDIGLQVGLLQQVRYRYESKNPIVGTVEADIADQFRPYIIQAVIGFGGHQIGTEHVGLAHGLQIAIGVQDAVQTGDEYAWLKAPVLEGKPLSAYQPTFVATVQYTLTFLYKIPKSGR